jgi:hypothetical protein
LIKTIFKNFPNIYTYLGTNLRYIPVVISKSAHPSEQWPPATTAGGIVYSGSVDQVPTYPGTLLPVVAGDRKAL